MIVLVSLSVPELFHQPGRRIENVRRRRQRTELLGRPLGLAPGNIGAVRFRRGAEVNHQFGDRQLAFRRAEPLVGVPRGNRHLQSLRVGQTDILRRKPGQPPQKVERILPAGNHPRRPVERSVGVGAAQ